MHQVTRSVVQTGSTLLIGAVAVSAPALGGAQELREHRSARAENNLVKPAPEAFAPRLVERLRVPAGFRVEVYASGLGAPRMLAVGEDGTLYATRRDPGDVIAVRAGTATAVVRGLPDVHGIALHRGRMYLATITDLYVADVGRDGTVGKPHKLAGDLPDGGQHPNRTIAVGDDGMLYVSVGSTCNACDEPNEEHATMLRVRPDGSERAVYATGLRNTVGFAFHPETRVLWGMDHGSDARGDDTPPEELNRLGEGRDYGWPFCYGDRRVDSLISAEPAGQTRDERCRATEAPVLTYQAHSAPMQMAFYTGARFPAEYRGDAFVAMRGSWNRRPPAGYKVVRVRFDGGKPTRIDDFVTGFLSEDGRSSFARPAGLAMGRDGAIYVSDDENGVIYRVVHGGR